MQSDVDPGLAATIDTLKAIDNHSHALPVRGPSSLDWERPDPLGEAPFHYPVRLRVTNPEYVEAWQALYGYRHNDMADGHVREAYEAKLRLIERKGEGYPAWVLDQAGIEIMLVNMESLGPGQDAPRFRWVPRADGLLSPFAGREAGSAAGLPVTLDAYVDAVVNAQIRQWKGAGALAIKFGIAYRRPLDVADVPAGKAEAIYERGLREGTLCPGDVKVLQDALFRAAAREAGRQGLPVHIHTGVGSQPFFNIGGSNPILLEATFNDATLRHTTFVMLHGGWPFEREAGVMLLKPNVRLDFSSQPFLRSTEALSAALQGWLEWYPEKVLFGTDAYPDDTPLANWEEKTWLVARTVRRALALALTRMMQEGQITRVRAEELAQMVLRENARALYNCA